MFYFNKTADLNWQWIVIHKKQKTRWSQRGIIPAKQGWASDVKQVLISFTSEAEVGFRAKNRYHFLLRVLVFNWLSQTAKSI